MFKYYKTEIKIINDEKHYGDLPKDYVIGYEHEGFAYFPLANELIDSNPNFIEFLEEISEEEYQGIIDTLNQLEEQKRQEDYQKFLEEVEAKKQAQQETQTKIELIQEQTKVDFDLAKLESSIKQKIDSGEITAATFSSLPLNEQEVVKLVLFKEFSPAREDIPRALSAVEFGLIILFKLLGKAIDRTKLTNEEQSYLDLLLNVINLNDMPIDDFNDWRTQYFKQQYEGTQNKRNAYYQKKMDVTGTW